MNKKIVIAFASMLTLALGVTAMGEQAGVATYADDANVTTYLVLSSVGKYNGNSGENFAAPLYLENTIKYEAKAGTDLPGKEAVTAPGTNGEFDHWETYEGTGFPTVYEKVPNVSGKILYAFYKNTNLNPDPPGPGPGPGPDPAGETTYYLNTGGSSLWNQANAWFAAYVWGSSGETWYTMTPVSGDIYSFSVDTSVYQNVIFTRMNSGALIPSWEGDTVWNQTADLTLGSSNCYTITGWGQNDGSWGTYSV